MVDVGRMQDVWGPLRRHRDLCLSCRRWDAPLPRRPSVLSDLVYAALATPLGCLWVASSERGVVAAAYATDELAFSLEVERLAGVAPTWAPEAVIGLDALAGYLAGGPSPGVPIDLRSAGFVGDVLRAVRAIPYGEVRSYGEVASMAGRPRAARAVGNAMRTNPLALLVPCHRVVRADGSLGGYGMGTCGQHYKAALLQLEGAVPQL